MKKTTLAIALASLIPTWALAQSSVTLYGIVDVGLAAVNNGATSAIKIDSGIGSTSRWGLRGSEDLGSGLKAIFNIEGGFNADDGTGKTAGGLDFTRRSIVGLNGGFGELRMGRDYTPAYAIAGTWDILGHSLLGNALNYTSTAGGTAVRFSNALFYTTPSMGGFAVNAGYSFGEVAGNSSASRGYGLSLGYNAGPVNAGAYFESTNNATGLINTKKMGLGGGYNFGPGAVKLGWHRTNPDGANNNITFWNLGGSFNLGAGQLMAQYSRMNTEVGATTNTVALAYLYSLSKRTQLYASLAQATNNATGLGALRGGDVTYAPAAVGADPRAFALGVRHNF